MFNIVLGIITAMIYLRFSILLFILTMFSTSVYSQKIVAFDKNGKVKRIKYYKGELIRLKLDDGLIYQGTITMIKDSSFTVVTKEIKLVSVVKVYNTQKYAGFDFFGKFFIIAGTIYFPLDVFNKTINDDSPIVSEESAAISAALLGTGLLFKSIANRGYKISPKRPLKIIDLAL